MGRVTIFGPPGTGKTTAGIDLATGWYRDGARPEDVAYLAFTRAAANEAAYRISEEEPPMPGEESPFPLFRTIHSLCYRSLRRAKKDVRVMRPTDWKDFANSTGFKASFEALPWEDLAEVFMKLDGRGKTEWDNIRAAYALTRLGSRDEDDLDSARMGPSDLAVRLLGNVDTLMYRSFVQRYDQFRKSFGLIDFTDMLEFGLTDMAPMDCRFVVIDEAQDLCPLHFSIIERIFYKAELIVFIGDDDQAIYRFSGASSDEFLNQAQKGKMVTLQQTHRFGQPIVDFSAQIIDRVERRVTKNVRGVEGKNGTIGAAGYFNPTFGDYFVLHRHVHGCQSMAARFIDKGIPFRNERGKNPLGAKNRVDAFRQIGPLAKGQKIPFAKARFMIEELLPSVYMTPMKTKIRLVVHGGKKRMDTVRKYETSLNDLVFEKILTTDGMETIKQKRYGQMNHTPDLEYYDRCEANGYSLIPSGPTITTIHGSKGRQAPFVVLFSEMTQRCFDDYDSEHRLAYVAATRTQSDVMVVQENTTDWMQMRYPYPL
jgi:superfamily I DNA/RNA helicase